MEKGKNILSVRRLKHLVENAKVSIFGLILSSFILLYILHPLIPKEILYSWLLLTVLTSILRWYFYHRFLQKFYEDQLIKTEKYENLFSLFAYISSLTYGVFSYWFYDYVPYSIKSFLIIIAAGMCAVAMNGYASSKKIFIPYSILIMSPFAIWYFQQGTQLNYIMCFLIIFFCGMIIKSSLAMNSYIITFMETKQDNEHLLLNLKKRKRQLETTNKDLIKHIEQIDSLKEKLIQQESLAGLGVLTSGLAHEIRNPLNIIINASKILETVIDDLKEEKEKIEPVVTMDLDEAFSDMDISIDLIGKEGKKADEIVGHLLASYTTQEEDQRKPFSINELIEEMADTTLLAMKGKISSSKGILQRNFQKDIPKIKGQRNELSKAIYNLIYNSFEAIDEKYLNDPENYHPLLKISSKKVESSILISIYDNGIGISEKDMKLIFTPFYTTKPTNKATGLGLTVSFEIINNLFKGDIKVESKLGQFTKIEISIPIQSESK
ncbi:hypothetical protein A9Q84_02215 [Halobacteriovorax marinus]|uniref:histidine kinase n=1 Tax=Halobacteriovorax marinus TaxID=97084 RepID=A0A1Y5FI46_9BACT|nr:hypothetical protein A9Q84_02215 [Halobacteriovorax marinus]